MRIGWRILQGLGVLIGLSVLALIGRCASVDNEVFNEKKRGAQAFCARFAVGTSMEEVRAAARALTDADSLQVDANLDQVVVGYKPPVSLLMHQCIVDGEKGRVVRSTYRLLD
jgi:hypothetical protein